MNRHQRRAAAGKRRELVELEILYTGQLLRRMRLNLVLATTVVDAARMMASEKPPKCAGCEGFLTMAHPPTKWVVLRLLSDGHEILAGACPTCAASPDLGHRIAHFCGGRLLPSNANVVGHA
jgi:hypothetical protein